jgi:hypothetical protein
MDGVKRIRQVLRGDSILLDRTGHYDLIFDHVYDFLDLSRDNGTVEKVTLCLPFIDPDNEAFLTEQYAFWDKIAQGIGNLQALREIVILDAETHHPIAPDWGILACILRRRRRGIQLRMHDGARHLWDTETLPAFARVIRGHAMITGFRTGNAFAFDCLNILCSTLLTLPALENVYFEQLGDGVSRGPEEEQSLESMVKLLQSPTLQQVLFESIAFTNTLSQAVAKALKEKSEITDLYLILCCFPEGGGAVIVDALKKNTTLKCLNFYILMGDDDEAFYEVLAAALLSNSTLQKISLRGSSSCSWLSPLFLALQVDSGLKELCIDGIERIDEKLSTAMRLGLRNNSTLETLKLRNITSGDKDTCLWREALSFLRANTALKTLHVQFDNVTNSRAATIRMEVLAMLCENESLETLEMITRSEYAGLKDYLKCVEAIQSNTTLKKLQLHEEDCYVDLDEFKDLIPVLKKNYGLEDFPRLDLGAGDIRCILDLNRAGRRYLVQDGSSISKGVAVLSRVNDDTNSIFLHLLENPRLCDRSAVEMSSSSIGNMYDVGSTSPGNRHSGEKREQQAPSHPGKETRRRLE